LTIGGCISEASDWRLNGQDKYLTGAVLSHRPYARWSAEWDHDHCAFCGAKFAEAALIPEALHAGYATQDAYHWICEECFGDFAGVFAWTVVPYSAP
jgi:ribosomal protein L37AE/L43A